MQYRYRPAVVDAMYFDGTPLGSEAIIRWLQAAAPDWVVRQRIEYAGWDDQAGHIELEIQDHDDQLVSGDWIVVEPSSSGLALRVLDSATFQRLFEPDQG